MKPANEGERKRWCYATTSAALKLLRRRRTLLNPGRSDLVAGMTTALALFVIHASELAALPAPRFFPNAVPTSCRELVALWCVRLVDMRVGRREGEGEGGARSVRRLPGIGARAVDAAVVRAEVPVASLGILLGPWPEVEGGLREAPPPVDRNILDVGRCSDTVAREPIVRVGALALGRECIPRAGRTSSTSTSSSESTGGLFAFGVFLGCPGGAISFAFA